MRKFTLPEGFENEPDIVKGYHMGVAYRVIRHPKMGHLCGYAKLPIGHPWLKKALALKWEEKWFSRKYHRAHKGYDYAPISNVRVHGGITFFGKLSRGRGYWIGFDCAHCDDLVPGLRIDWTVYRDVEYVRRNCKELAKAIAEAK